MRRTLGVASVLLISTIAFGVSVYSSGGISSAAGKHPKMHMGNGTGHMMGPVSFMNDHQVAPAITAPLTAAGVKACGRAITGAGSVRLIPVHVGKMSGPHVDMVVRVHGAGMMRRYGISGSFIGKAPVRWSGMAATVRTGMHGNIFIKTRLMPMLRAGRYTARIVLRDMACGSMMNRNLAYRTPITHIRLR